MIALGCGQRGNRFSGAAGSGLTIAGSGTLNGSSPTANLAGINIKGNEAFSFIPQKVSGVHGTLLCNLVLMALTGHFG
jgi:hypothetical protein